MTDRYFCQSIIFDPTPSALVALHYYARANPSFFAKVIDHAKRPKNSIIDIQIKVASCLYLNITNNKTCDGSVLTALNFEFDPGDKKCRGIAAARVLNSKKGLEPNQWRLLQLVGHAWRRLVVLRCYILWQKSSEKAARRELSLKKGKKKACVNNSLDHGGY